MYKCSKCLEEGTAEEWNKATESRYGKFIKKIEEAMEDIHLEYHHICPNCEQDCISIENVTKI